MLTYECSSDEHENPPEYEELWERDVLGGLQEGEHVVADDNTACLAKTIL